MRTILLAFVSAASILVPTHRSEAQTQQKWVNFATDPGTLQVWNQAFAGVPGPLTENSWLNLLGPQPVCKAQAKELVADLKTYRDLLTDANADAKLVAEHGQKLEKRVRDLSASNDPCKESLLATYTVGSVFLLTRSWQVEGSPRLDGERALPSGASWGYLAIAAARNGILSFRSEKTLNREGKDHHRLLGSYDCGKYKIVVNPAQRPLNLGATLIHEFTHLFIDRFSAFNMLKGLRTDTVREFLILEEALASLHGGFFQREFAQRALSPRLNSEEFGDLTFFSKSGPLSEVAKRIQVNGGIITDDPFESLAVATFFLEHDMRLDDTELVQGGQKAIDRYKQDLFNRISKIYFGHRLSKAAQKKMSPAGLNSLFSDYPLGGGHAIQISIDRYFTMFSKILWPNRWSVGGQLKQSQRSELGFIRLLDSSGRVTTEIDMSSAIQMIASLLDPDSRLKSRLCSNFENAVKKSELRSYLGTAPRVQGELTCQPPTDKTSASQTEDASRPPRCEAEPDAEAGEESDAIKPGVDGVRPKQQRTDDPAKQNDGIHDARPESSDGIKGVDGVRPSTDAVRPCVQIGDRI